MFALDLFNTKFERNLQEGATDDRNAGLRAKMEELVERARNCSTMEERDSLLQEYAALKETAQGYSLPAKQIPGKQDLLKTPVTGFEKAKAAAKDIAKGIAGRKDVEHFGSGRSVDEGFFGNLADKLNWDSGDIKDTQPNGDVAVKQAFAAKQPSREEMRSPEFRQKMIANLTARAKAGDKGAAASLAALQRSAVAETEVAPPKHYGGQGTEGAKFDVYMQQRKAELEKQRPESTPTQKMSETQKKNSKKPQDQRLSRLKVKARREYPRAETDDEAVALTLLDKEQSDVDRLSRENEREDRMIARLNSLEQNLQQQLDDLKLNRELEEHGGGIGPKHWQDAMQEGRMGDIDAAIQERLVAGMPPEEIAQELNIPLDWVEEYKFTKVSDSPVDMFGNQLDRQHSSMNEDDVDEAVGQKFIVTLQNVTTKKTSTVLVSAQDEDDAKDMVRHHAGLGQAIINAQPARGNEQTTYVFQGGRLMPTQGVAEAGNKPGWALDPKTRLELKKRQERQKTIAKYAGKDAPKQDVKEFAPGKDRFEPDNTSEIVKTIKRLLDSGNKVDSMLAGSRGHIYAVAPDLAGFSMKKYNKPRAGGGLFRFFGNDEDDQVMLKMIKPGHYQLWNKELVDETDETSWTANSAQFRREEDLSWPVEVTLEPKADINKGRGSQVKTMTVSAQSRDAAKKKLVDYYRKNGWAVTGIKFAGDLGESDSGDYEYPYTMSARDKGRYDAITGREYNNPYSAFGTEEDHKNAIEYSAAYDSVGEQGVKEGWFDAKPGSWRNPKPGIDDAGRALMKQDRQAHPDMDDYSWQLGWIYADGDKDVKAAYKDAYYDNPTVPSPPEPRSFKLGFNARSKQGVAEGVKLKFHTVELTESQVSSYTKKYFECYNIDQPHTKFVSNVKRLGSQKLNESKESQEIIPFIQMIKSVDTNKTIKVGDYFSVLAFEIVFAWKEINASGFTNPKEVADIKMHSDGTINYIKFTDGDRYPRLTPATYQGKPILQTAYFTDADSAKSALTALALKVPDGWEFNASDVKQGVEEGSQQYHVVSKLDGNVLASYKTREEAHKNSHGNPVVSGSLETIGDRQYVREQGVVEGWSGNEPTWVCVNGKRWKKFPTHDHARNVGDKLQAKFRKEGRKDVVSYDFDAEDVEEAFLPRDIKAEKQRRAETEKYQADRATPYSPEADRARTASMKGAIDRLSNKLKDRNINEDIDTSPVQEAILHRIMVEHKDLLVKFGPEKLMSAAEDVAYNVQPTDNISKHDVSSWVHQVKQILGEV